jgi:GAF domain-containing protein
MSPSADRLRLLYDVNRRLTTFTDLDALVRFATRGAREVFAADGCSLLLLDRARREFYFPVASQSEGRRDSEAPLKEIRFGADHGIAGWVLTNDRTAVVNEAAADPRFFPGVDQSTGMTTHAVLCAPLRTRSGNIGVIEVINPQQGTFTPEDAEFLEALAGDVAIAYEKALLYADLQAEVFGLRQACRVVGLVLVGAGLLFGTGTVLGHLAWALPLGELPTRPGMLAAVGALLVGGILVALGRGWLAGRAARHREGGEQR